MHLTAIRALISGLIIWLILPVSTLAAPVGFTFDVTIRGFPVGEVRFKGDYGASEYAFEGFMGTRGFFGSFIGTRYSGAVIGSRRGGTLRPRIFRGRFEQRRQFAQVDIRYQGNTPTQVERTPAIDRKPWDIPLGRARGAVDPISAIWLLLQDRTDRGLCTQSFRSFDGSRLAQVSLAKRPGTDAGEVICDGAYVRLAGFAPATMAERVAYPFRLIYTARGDGAWRVQEFQAETVWGRVRAKRRQ